MPEQPEKSISNPLGLQFPLAAHISASDLASGKYTLTSYVWWSLSILESNERKSFQKFYPNVNGFRHKII